MEENRRTGSLLLLLLRLRVSVAAAAAASPPLCGLRCRGAGPRPRPPRGPLRGKARPEPLPPELAGPRQGAPGSGQRRLGGEEEGVVVGGQRRRQSLLLLRLRRRQELLLVFFFRAPPFLRGLPVLRSAPFDPHFEIKRFRFSSKRAREQHCRGDRAGEQGLDVVGVAAACVAVVAGVDFAVASRRRALLRCHRPWFPLYFRDNETTVTLSQQRPTGHQARQRGRAKSIFVSDSVRLEFSSKVFVDSDAPFFDRSITFLLFFSFEREKRACAFIPCLFLESQLSSVEKSKERK